MKCWFRIKLSLTVFINSLSVVSFWFSWNSFLKCIFFCLTVRLRTFKVLCMLLQQRLYNPETRQFSLFHLHNVKHHQNEACWKEALAMSETNPRCCASQACSSLMPLPLRSCCVYISFQFSTQKDKRMKFASPHCRNLKVKKLVWTSGLVSLQSWHLQGPCQGMWVKSPSAGHSLMSVATHRTEAVTKTILLSPSSWCQACNHYRQKKATVSHLPIPMASSDCPPVLHTGKAAPWVLGPVLGPSI